MSTPRIVIEPPSGWHFINLREIWRYRDLLVLWTWRTIMVQYKQTVLGPLWAILSPVGTMLVFTFVFGNLAQMPSDDIPYPIFSYAGLVPWTFFSTSTATAAASILGNGPLIKKIYFPRVIMPLSAILTRLVDFVLALSVLVLMIVIYNLTGAPAEGEAAAVVIRPTWGVLMLPVLLIPAFVTALGLGIWFGALNAQFRDATKVLAFLTTFWLYITPVAYSSTLFSGSLEWLLVFNPMAPVVNGFRWALLGTPTAPGLEVIPSMVLAVFLLLSGMLYFRRTEHTIVDVM